MRVTMLSAVLVLFGVSAAAAADPGTFPAGYGDVCVGAPAAKNVFAVSFGEAAPVVPALRLSAAALDPQAAPRRAVPVDYSDAYKMRARIHKIASLATVPLFAAQYLVGQDLYKNPGGSESKKSLHGGLAATTAGLFGVNSITGVWNLWEGRKDINHRTRRMTHGILMLVADAGFVATGLLTPDDDEGQGTTASSNDRRSTHRAVALTSMGVATISYLVMLLSGD